MSGLELFDWMNQLVMAHTINQSLNQNRTKDDSKPKEVGDESFFTIIENGDAGNS